MPRMFHLVIEVLLISSSPLQIYEKLARTPRKFQSRNRGSFDFKSMNALPRVVLSSRPVSISQSRFF